MPNLNDQQIYALLVTRATYEYYARLYNIPNYKDKTIKELRDKIYKHEKKNKLVGLYTY